MKSIRPIGRFWRGLSAVAKQRGHRQLQLAAALHTTEPTFSRWLHAGSHLPKWTEVESALKTLGLVEERGAIFALWEAALRDEFGYPPVIPAIGKLQHVAKKPDR